MDCCGTLAGYRYDSLCNVGQFMQRAPWRVFNYYNNLQLNGPTTNQLVVEPHVLIPGSALLSSLKRNQAIRIDDPAAAGYLPAIKTPLTLILSCLIDREAYEFRKVFRATQWMSAACQPILNRWQLDVGNQRRSM